MITASDALNALRSVIDPDIGLNIVDLGLVDQVTASPDQIQVTLLMTTPACPQSSYLQDECVAAIAATGGRASVEIRSQPLWSPERLSPQAREALGW